VASSEEQSVAESEVDMMNIPDGFNRMPSRFDWNQIWPTLNIHTLSSDIITEGLHVETVMDVGSHAFAFSQAAQAVGRTKQAIETKLGITNAHPNPVIAGGLEQRPDWRAQYDAHAANTNTIRFLRDRSYKQASSAVASATGNIIAWLATYGLNPIAGPQHAHAMVTSGIHWYKIQRIAKRHSGTAQHVTDWCKNIINLKRHKSITRVGQTAARNIPFVPFVGTAINLVSVLSSLSYRIAHAEVAGMIAVQIHAHAFDELATESAPQRNARKAQKKPAGPGSEIFEEILTRRGVYQWMGSYDIETLIAEPGGWMALANKLLLD
jgi:hypothetical protein